MCCITKTHRPALQSSTRRDTGGSNMNLVGPVSPGTKQPTRKEDPRSAHTRSTFQPQNSSSQSIQCPDCPPIHTSGCHHDRVVDMQIVITTWLSHSSHLKQCGHVSCQFMGFVPGSPGRSCSETLAQRIVSRTADIFILLFFLWQRTTDCALHKKVQKEACRKIRNVSCPVWAKVLADDRPFCHQKESDSSNSERQTRVNQSINQLINHGPVNSIWSRCIPAPGPPARELRRQKPESDFQHSPNIERSPCSNHREPVPWSAKSGCVSSSPDTVHQWANVSALVSAFTRLVQWPLLAP